MFRDLENGEIRHVVDVYAVTCMYCGGVGGYGSEIMHGLLNRFKSYMMSEKIKDEEEKEDELELMVQEMRKEQYLIHTSCSLFRFFIETHS